MDIIEYFSTLEQRPLVRLSIMVGGIMLLWIIEGSIPLHPLSYRKNKLRHAGVNFVFTVMHLVIHTFLAILIVLLSDWCAANEFGLVYWLNAGVFGAIIIGVLALDFSGWLVHLVMHKVRFLWRFHLIHHTDTKVDVTTGLRHHPGDSFLRGLFFLLLIFVSGAPVYSIMIYYTLAVLATGFTHANISLHPTLDRALGWVLVSPNMHKVHHHWKQPYTDSNYGTVFSIWDRLFGTLLKLEPSQIKYGIDKHYPEGKDEDVIALLKKPFQKLDLP